MVSWINAKNYKKKNLRAYKCTVYLAFIPLEISSKQKLNGKITVLSLMVTEQIHSNKTNIFSLKEDELDHKNLPAPLMLVWQAGPIFEA